jgi:plasmid stabilization system protein ParE
VARANLPFEYHPAAIIEAHQAFHWYAERSSQAADRFWNELIRVRKLVTEQPESWTPYFHETRVFPFRKFPGLVYIERPDRIIGLAVCHFSRSPGYWRERME